MATKMEKQLNKENNFRGLAIGYRGYQKDSRSLRAELEAVKKERDHWKKVALGLTK